LLKLLLKRRSHMSSFRHSVVAVSQWYSVLVLSLYWTGGFCYCVGYCVSQDGGGCTTHMLMSLCLSLTCGFFITFLYLVILSYYTCQFICPCYLLLFYHSVNDLYRIFCPVWDELYRYCYISDPYTDLIVKMLLPRCIVI